MTRYVVRTGQSTDRVTHGRAYELCDGDTSRLNRWCITDDNNVVMAPKLNNKKYWDIVTDPMVGICVKDSQEFTVGVHYLFKNFERDIFRTRDNDHQYRRFSILEIEETFELQQPSLSVEGINPSNNPYPEQEHHMLKIEEITLINGTDSNTISDERLIDIIITGENELERLGSIKIESKAVKAWVRQLNKDLKSLVAILDNRS